MCHEPLEWERWNGERTPPDTGHVDLSITRYALQALRVAGLPPLIGYSHFRSYVSSAPRLRAQLGTG